jgi:hypothetical protein
MIARRWIIVIENDTIGDGYWMPTVAKALREYASLIEAGKLGNTFPHVYESEEGNRLIATGGTLCGELLTTADFRRLKESQEADKKNGGRP